MFLVLGNATVDESMAVKAFPAPRETVVVAPPTRDLGGKGANQAIVLARAGAPTRLVAAIGGDSEGAWIKQRLSDEGLARDLLTVETATDRSLIFIGEGGENMIASTVAAAAALTPEIARAEAAKLPRGGVLVLQGNLSLAATKAALQAARTVGARNVFNPSPFQQGFAAMLPLVDLLIVNEPEAAQLGGDAPDLRARGAGAVALTLGARGSLYADAAGVQTIAAPRLAAVDTTGAGDAYAGVLTAALYHRRLPASAALAAATAAAALTVQRPGAASSFPSRAELDAIFAACFMVRKRARIWRSSPG